MSTITILHNLFNKEWSAETNNLASNYSSLQIGFRSNTSNVIFEGLSFRVELKKSNNSIRVYNFPENNIEYRSSSQAYLVSIPLKLEPQTEYVIAVWAENSGKSSTFNYTLSTPSPTDTGDYKNASIPHPDPDNLQNYRFDEGSRSWVLSNATPATTSPSIPVSSTPTGLDP
jgi:hypothetical protein